MGSLDPIAGFMGGFGSIANLISTQATNNTNYNINSQNIKAQKDLAASSEAWLSNENQIAREWNSPVNQMELYRQAGINPFLSESANVGYAGSAPSSAPTPSAPNPIPMQAPHFDFNAAIQQAISSKAVDASAAANRAEAFSRFVGAIPTISRYLDNDAVKALLDEYLPQFIGSEYKGSQEYQLTQLAIEQNSFERDMASVQASIAEKYGDDKAQQEVWNLQQHSAKLATEMGLYNSLAKLNESNVSLNAKKVDELTSEIYRNIQEANYKQKLGLTQDQMRTFVVSQAALDVLNGLMDYQSHKADFEEERGVREYKSSDLGVMSATSSYVTDHNIVTKGVDFVVDRASKVVGLKNKLPTFGAPWQDNGVRYRETRPNQYGGKTSKEWIYYPPQN